MEAPRPVDRPNRLLGAGVEAVLAKGEAHRPVVRLEPGAQAATYPHGVSQTCVLCAQLVTRAFSAIQGSRKVSPWRQSPRVRQDWSSSNWPTFATSEATQRGRESAVSRDAGIISRQIVSSSTKRSASSLHTAIPPAATVRIRDQDTREDSAAYP